MKREELQDAIHEMLANDGPFLLEACVIEGGKCIADDTSGKLGESDVTGMLI